MKDTYPMYAINIDNELNILEKFFNKYNPMDEETKKYLKFIPTMRDPITPHNYRDYYKPNNFISSTPYMPYLCLACVENYVMFNIYNNSYCYDVFISNPLRKNSKNFLENYYGTSKNDIDPYLTIITSWLNTVEISIEHYSMIKNILDRIVKQVTKYTNHYPNHIWELDYRTSNVILINRGDIRAYRFEELRGLK